MILTILSALVVVPFSLSAPANPCLAGEAYWCQDLRTSLQCKALRYCLEEVWPKQRATNAKAIDGSAGPCQICEKIVTEVGALVKQNKTVANINAFADGFCDKIMPPAFRAPCKMYVDTYVQVVIKVLESLLDGHAICEKLGFCANVQNIRRKDKTVPPDNGGVHNIRGKAEAVTPGNEADNDDCPRPWCSMCHTVLGLRPRKNRMGQHPRDTLAYLDSACQAYPQLLKAQCNFLVEHFLLNHSDMERLGGRSSEVCRASAVCAPQASPPLTTLPTDLSFPGVCGVCEMIISYLDRILGNNRTEDAIIKALHFVCSKLPDFMAGPCETFVERYFKTLLNLLLNAALKPSTVCTLVGACFQEMSVITSDPLWRESCPTIMENVPADSPERMKRKLFRECATLPEPLQRPLCTFILHQFGDDVIEVLSSGMLDDSRDGCMVPLAPQPLPEHDEQ